MVKEPSTEKNYILHEIYDLSLWAFRMKAMYILKHDVSKMQKTQ